MAVATPIIELFSQYYFNSIFIHVLLQWARNPFTKESYPATILFLPLLLCFLCGGWLLYMFFWVSVAIF